MIYIYWAFMIGLIAIEWFLDRNYKLYLPILIVSCVFWFLMEQIWKKKEPKLSKS